VALISPRDIRSTMKKALAISSALIATVTLMGCTNQVDAPLERGACWHAVPMSDGTIKFNDLAKNQPSIEACAARLEDMRLNFKALGSQQRFMVGAYQGNYLFLQPEGVFTARSYKGNRYLVLVRTGDGRLAKIGEMPLQ
jgi:hypothetical protein